jgi:hypothetical protein
MCIYVKCVCVCTRNDKSDKTDMYLHTGTHLQTFDMSCSYLVVYFAHSAQNQIDLGVTFTDTGIFTREQLSHQPIRLVMGTAIEYIHMHNKKIYVYVNDIYIYIYIYSHIYSHMYIYMSFSKDTNSVGKKNTICTHTHMHTYMHTCKKFPLMCYGTTGVSSVEHHKYLT